MDIFGSGISLKSIIPSFQCEITNEAEHIGPLTKGEFSKFPIANIELGWLTSKKTLGTKIHIFGYKFFHFPFLWVMLKIISSMSTPVLFYWKYPPGMTSN